LAVGDWLAFMIVLIVGVAVGVAFEPSPAHVGLNSGMSASR
jgi:hypothetical protein